ncbi:MAG: Na/Pi cotransporter family protein [Clostridiales bacterium]|jgi:phosphate:Na+ symporter|nr:Na/Pi cotransporter family protein [Clostridiales bacterium]
MSVFNMISLLGGLAFFLYGMSIMASGLERASGGRLEKTLEKMTGNIFKAIFLGALVTATIQSSSATTVIVVGLVNAKILKLKQAIGIIMGANIGTTITAHILRLSDIDASSNVFLTFFKPVTLAPLAAIIGVLLYVISKRRARRDIGQILIGFGVLFSGMFAMEGAVEPLKDLPQFAVMFERFTNPILGVLIGTFVTAVIQSSAASIGILQALTSTGAITFASAFPIIMGQNIGTCITPVLASIGASRNAKRSAFIHVSFNTIGTILFLIAIYAMQYTVGLPFWDEPITKGGIANFHTIFNVVVTIIFIPFAGLLEKLAKFAIKTNAAEAERDDETKELDERFLTAPAYAIQHAREAVIKMASLAQENFGRSIEIAQSYDAKKLELLREIEDVIDRLQGRIDSYLLKLANKELTESENTALSEVLQVVNEFERIGDLANNIGDCAQEMFEKGIVFSGIAMRELELLRDAVGEILAFAVDGYTHRDIKLAETVEPLEAVINILVEALKLKHSERLRSGECSVDSAFPYVQILYNMERIADHCSNVGVHVISYSGQVVIADRHEFLRELRNSQSDEFREKFELYDMKYYERLKNI